MASVPPTQVTDALVDAHRSLDAAHREMDAAWQEYDSAYDDGDIVDGTEDELLRWHETQHKYSDAQQRLVRAQADAL